MRDLASELEPVMLGAWPATDVERLDGWLLRAAEGHTSRANSIHVLGPSSRPLDDLMAYGMHWYQSRGLPVRFRLHDKGESAALDSELAPASIRSNTVETLWRTIDADKG
ncbi:MAG: hypothetical protein HKN07_11430 [Acidimicrobiia bacterium]|nr:hypothetical protein [Acidimicrobiia bacterium]